MGPYTNHYRKLDVSDAKDSLGKLARCNQWSRSHWPATAWWQGRRARSTEDTQGSHFLCSFGFRPYLKRWGKSLSQGKIGNLTPWHLLLLEQTLIWDFSWSSWIWNTSSHLLHFSLSERKWCSEIWGSLERLFLQTQQYCPGMVAQPPFTGFSCLKYPQVQKLF